MKQKVTRREFVRQMLGQGALAYIATHLGGVEKLFAQTANYQYFVGIMPHSLALLKTQNDVSIHGNFFQGYGNWRFNGAGSLSGLDAIKGHVLVPRGLTYRTEAGTEAVGHFQAHGGFLTGYPSRGASDYDMLVGPNNITPAASTTQSIDWMIAKSIGKEPLAVGYHNRPVFNGAEAPHFFRALSWRDSLTAHYPTFDSKVLLNQLKIQARCSSYTGDPAQIQKEIDKVGEQLKVILRVQQQYSRFYRRHRKNADAFEQYIDDFGHRAAALRQDLERLNQSLTTATTKPVICDAADPAFFDSMPSISDNATYENKVRELNTLVALSFKTGLTNAATMSLCLEENHVFQHYISNINVNDAISGQTTADVISYGAGLKQYMDSVNRGVLHLVSELKRFGIFDKTLILVGGEQNDGNAHVANEAPVYIVDGKNAGWNGQDVGVMVSGQGMPEARPYSDLLVDILKKFGLNVAQLGSDKNVKGVGRGGLI